METQLTADEGDQRWSLATKIAFRFCFVYLGLFCCYSQIFWGLLPPIGKYLRPSSLVTLWPMRPLVSWVAVHVLEIRTRIFYSRWDGGDQIATWVALFCVLIIAVATTGIWSIMDRRRDQYSRLFAWFRLFIRFSVASEVIAYGLVKVFALQMPAPLYQLVEPVGDFSPADVLWAQVGSSQPYEILLGCAEVVGGVLLVVPRTTTAGALLCAVDMTQVFILNMTYGIPAKLISFHLLLLSLFLLAPESKRLVSALFLNRAVGPSTQWPLFRGHCANGIALVLQVALGLWILGWYAGEDSADWHRRGDGAPRPALYGIWNVGEFAVDGREHPSLTADSGRWQHLIIDRGVGKFLSGYQQMDNSLTLTNSVKIDMSNQTIVLPDTNTDGTSSTTTFRFNHTTDDQLILDGEWNRHRTHMQLQRLNLNQFSLVNNGFSWVQVGPYTRAWL